MEEEKIAVLSQLVGALEQAEPRLEEAYKNQDETSFSKLKKFILGVQKRISEVVDDARN